jgi:peptidoglycan-associated lipoprotein
MKKIQVLCCLLALSLAGCQKQQKQEYAGVDGDYVNGTPLPPRQEGISFFSNNVTKGQFQPLSTALKSLQMKGASSGRLGAF